MLSAGSCDAILEEDITDYGQGPNFVGFSSASLTLGAETNGEEVQTTVPIRIIGPSVPQINDEVTVTVSVDPSSTAVEGVHYRLDSNTVTLNPVEGEADVFQGGIPITILTEGLEAPLDATPVLVLNMTDAETSANVVINDKTETTTISLAYACPFDIKNYEGTFIATTDEFGIYLGATQPFEVVSGPGENQITLINPAAHPEEYDLVIDVDPSNGNLTIERQPFLNYNNFGATQYGELRIEGTGTSGASGGECIGNFGFDTGYFVDAGTFGTYGMEFERVADDSGDEDEDEDQTEE